MIPLRGVIALIAFYTLNWAVIALGLYCVARSVTFIPFEDVVLVGSAQAIGYVAALVTLIAPAGLGVKDAAFAWAMKAALPSKSFALGSLIAIAVRGVLTVGRTDLRRDRHRPRPQRGLERPHRDPPCLSRGGRGGARSRRRAPDSEGNAGAQLVSGQGEGQ